MRCGLHPEWGPAKGSPVVDARVALVLEDHGAQPGARTDLLVKSSQDVQTEPNATELPSCAPKMANATELPSCAPISARAAQKRRRRRWWRGEECARRPGPKGQVLRHVLRNVLHNALRRVLNVLAAAAAAAVVVVVVRKGGPMCRRRRAPVATHARTRGSTRRGPLNPSAATGR